MPCENIILQIITPNEVSQKEKDKYIWYHLYVKSKIQHRSLKQKQIHRHGEQTRGCLRGGGEGWTENLGLVNENYYI